MTNDTDDKGGYVIPVIDNIVNTQKVDTAGDNNIDSDDLLTAAFSNQIEKNDYLSLDLTSRVSCEEVLGPLVAE